MAEVARAATYNAWWASLNAVRAKHNVSQLTPTVVGVGTRMLSSQMVALQNGINTTKNSDSHTIAASIATTIPSIAVGNRILLSTKTTVDSIIAQLTAICHHTTYSNEGDEDPAYDGSDHRESSFTAVDYNSHDYTHRD